MTAPEARRLLARYRDGELSVDEQRQLTSAVLADQALYNAFAEELLFAEILEDPEFRAKVAAAVQPSPTRLDRLAHFLRGLGAGWQLAGVAMTTAALVMALVLYRANHSGESTVARGGTSRPVQVEPVRPAPESAPAVLALALVPSARAEGAAPKSVRLKGYKTVRLHISPGAGSYVTYRAVLASADTGFQREFSGLKAAPDSKGAPQLEFEFSSGLLRRGDYTVTVYGVTATGASQPAAGYSFSVVE